MIACEIIMLAALFTLAIYAAYKDCRTSQIPNRLLLAFALLALVIDTLYYSVWAGEWFGTFVINTLFLSGTSLLLYAYHLWAAGDSKLLINSLYKGISDIAEENGRNFVKVYIREV